MHEIFKKWEKKIFENDENTRDRIDEFIEEIEKEKLEAENEKSIKG